jgi:predicted short-subunit dehydrogenase-like oxidoreductase (DUF2520 family)
MPPRSRDPILVAGTGRLARALGRLLAEHGEPVAAVAGRDPAHTAAAAAFIGHGVKPAALDAPPKRCTRFLIAVSDTAIPSVASRLAQAGVTRGIALHTCGALGREALEPLGSAGVACGTLHPLQTVATPEQGLSALSNCAYMVDGDPEALAWAGRLAAELGAMTLRVPPEGHTYYHAAAVMASNYVIALVDAAVMLMRAAGIGDETARRALAPLVEASSANALRQGPVEALTGPVQRGDVETLRLHMRALRAAPDRLREFYAAAGLYALNIALRRGLPPGAAALVEKALREGEDDVD